MRMPVIEVANSKQALYSVRSWLIYLPLPPQYTVWSLFHSTSYSIKRANHEDLSLKPVQTEE